MNIGTRLYSVPVGEYSDTLGRLLDELRDAPDPDRPYAWVAAGRSASDPERYHLRVVRFSDRWLAMEKAITQASSGVLIFYPNARPLDGDTP